MPGQKRIKVLDLVRVETVPGVPGSGEHVRLHTNGGVVNGRLHRTAEGDSSVVWVFGAGGGLDGPAGGLYVRMAEEFAARGITSLRLDYRNPGHLTDSILDVLLGIRWLASLGKNRVVLVGHSFGGAVVITAGAVADAVIAVAALSSQTYGTEGANMLAPRPLLLIHGLSDEVLSPDSSRHIFARANEPKEMILYPGCFHGLDQCRESLDRDLRAWLIRVFESRNLELDTDV